MTKEQMNDEDRTLLSNFVTNVEGDVFALKNLSPELQAAVFGRYARSSKGARTLLVTEFRDQLTDPEQSERAREFNNRVFNEFGHASLSQLCTVHLGIEGVSQIATKLIERSRLCSYMEQSTRAIDWSNNPQYVVPSELTNVGLEEPYLEICDRAFTWYAKWMRRLLDAVYNPQKKRRIDKSAVLDIVRGALPLSIKSSLGMVGSAQSYASLISRLWTSPYVEAVEIGDKIFDQLTQVAPTFMRHTKDSVGFRTQRGQFLLNEEDDLLGPESVTLQGPSVRLIDWDQDWLQKLTSAVLFERGYGLEYGRQAANKLTYAQALRLVEGYCGGRRAYWQRPGRALESVSCEFEFVTDYGIFRDLQRHRMLTCEWQRPRLELGFDSLTWARPIVGDIWSELHSSWMTHMNRQIKDISALEKQMRDSLGDLDPVNQCIIDYAKPMATYIRYRIRCNIRELMHILELRTQHGGHESYRKICQQAFRDVQHQMPLIASIMLVNEESALLAHLP